MIPDPKYARPEIYRAYVRQAAAMGRLDLLERVMPHVADRPELTGALRAAGAVTYVHSLAGPADIQRFWDLGVGVYSDEPFPPLGAATPAVRAPAFDPATALPPA
jgi:hypothetical protein